jgi:hypothetical protein
VEEPWEAAAFARTPIKGLATDADDWARLFEVASSAQGPVPLGLGPPLAEAEVLGAQPRATIG